MKFAGTALAVGALAAVAGTAWAQDDQKLVVAIYKSGTQQYFIDQAMGDELVIVSPDAGRVKVARNFARKVGVHWAVMEKERPAQKVAEIGYVVGDVKDKIAIISDDMIDTAGTLCAAARTVLDEGASSVIACATHGDTQPLRSLDRLAELIGRFD